MKLGMCCRYCGIWSARSTDASGYPVCSVCGWMGHPFPAGCLVERAELVLDRYRREWSRDKGRFKRDLLAFKGGRIAARLKSGQIAARCKCAACRPVLPGLFEGGADAKAL